MEKAVKVLLTSIFGGRYNNIEKILTETKTISEIEDVLFNSLINTLNTIIANEKGDSEIAARQIQQRLRFPDRRKELINIFLTDTKGITDLDIFLLRSENHKEFANKLKELIDFEVNEDLLVDIIDKTVDNFSTTLWNSLSAEQISYLNFLKIEKQNTALKTLNNIPTYNGMVTILNEREQQRENEILALSKIERQLKKDEYFYQIYINSKRVILNIIHQKFHRFEQYTGYSIHHIQETLKLLSDILETELDTISNEELYVICLSVYLEYLGISQTQVPKSSSIYTELAINYLKENLFELKIEENYLEAFSTIIEGLYDTDISGYDNKIRVSNTKKVRVKFIISCIRLAKKLDLIHITSNTFLYNDTLPHLIESRKKWEGFDKAKFLNFSNSCVTINATCNEQNIYNALKKWILEVDELMKNSIKTLLSVDDDTFPIKSIIDNVHSENLPNKTNVGISIHKENIVKAFIGQIYENNTVKGRPDNKFIAIREIIQNAIDACLFKSLNDKAENYKPKVIVTLEDDFLVIQDNGIGMNIFVVENYFAQLGHSYYQHHLETKNNEIIAQFGVGVFSYLKIADYIDVETVKIGQKPLKFRIDSDVNTNFYFYENTTLQEGTIIRLKLKNNIKSELTPQLLHEVINFFFRFIDVDIFIETVNNNILLEQNNFNIDIQKYINNEIKREYQKTFEYELFNINHETKGYKANIGLILLYQFVNGQRIFIPVVSLSQLRNRNSHSSSTEISHKGVFIKNHSGSSIGKINIKTTQRLNYPRTEFIDKEYIQNIVNELGLILVSALFKQQGNNPKILMNFTDYIILNYYQGSNFTKEHLIFFQETFYCEFFDKNTYEYLPLKDIIQLENFNIVCLPIQKHSSNEKKDIYLKPIFDKDQRPILITTDIDFRFYYEFIIGKKFSINISSNNQGSYLTINTINQQSFYLEIENLKTFPFEDNYLFTVFFNQNLSVSTYINSNHRIIKYYQNNIENEERLEIMKSFFNSLGNSSRNFVFNRDNLPKAIEYMTMTLNHILKELNNPKLLLQQDDFPRWLLEMK